MNRSIARVCARAAFGVALASLFFAARAEARPEVLRFTYAEPERVASYRVLVGSQTGQSDLLDQTVTVGPPDASGTYQFAIDVASERTVYIRLTATGLDGTQSAASNEIQRSVPLGLPGQPMVILP